MKKIVFTVFTVLMSLIGFISQSQTMYKSYSVVAIDTDQSTPRYLVGNNDNVSDTLGIVITIKQAQKINNDLELFGLYRSMHNDCDSTVNFLVQVVDDYKKLNVLAQQKFKAYDISILNLKKQISNLNDQILVKDNQLFIKENIIRNKDFILDIDKRQIKHLKEQKTGLIIGGVVIGSGFIYMLLGHPGIR